MRGAPIRLRLTAWYAAVLAALLVGLGLFVVTRLRADLIAQVDRSLNIAATQIAASYVSEGTAELIEASREFLGGNDARAAGAQVLDSQARVVTYGGAPALGTALLDAATVRAVLAATRPQLASVRPFAGESRLRAIAIPVQRGGSRQVVVVADSLHDVEEAVQRVTLLLVIGGLTALTLACLGGWWIARKALRPVARMTTQAAAIDVAELAQRIPVPPTKDELHHLAVTLNAMLARIERGVAAREGLIADASHELRGPLAAMRAELEVTLLHESPSGRARMTLTSALEEVVRMSRIVDNMLTLARVDDGRLGLLAQRVDLGAIAAEGARPFVAAARSAGVRLDVLGDGSLPIDGDRDRLIQVVSNLVDNAVRVAPAGTAVRVVTARGDAEATLTVTDAGPGVPAELRESVFERFSRTERARAPSGGAGLGLAICREIVNAHGGHISLDDSALGEGTTVTVALPLAMSPTVN